jgi:surface protein
MNRDLYIKANSSGDWVRPSDWLPMPTNITSANQTFVGLHAVIENADNYVAFLFTTSAGQYRVDWGDGTVTLHNSNTIAQYQYNFATISNSTLTSRGYKQAMITVTAVSGNLLTCNFQTRFVTSPVQNRVYATGFLDCILSMPNATASGITFGGGTVRHTYVERVDVKTIGGCTTMNGMFNSCFSLQSVPLFNTASVTNMVTMFFNCLSLQSVPLFNTASVTIMSSMFINCYSLQSVPLFNTASVTVMNSMFQNCYSLQSVPLFNTASVTNMNNMFNNCHSFQSVPLFNTVSVISMTNMFQSCFSLQSVPLFNTASVTNMVTMFFNCNSLQSVPLFNTASVTNMNNMFNSCFSLQSVPNLTTLTTTTFEAWIANDSLGRIELSFTNSVNLGNCKLSKDAIVEIFTNLRNRTLTTSANINITGNWGASALSASDRLIATAKNWTITG